MLEAIYHPSYIPEREWFKIQLLLWDKIYRIVPDSVEENFGAARVADLWEIPEKYVPTISKVRPNSQYFDEKKMIIINQLKELTKKTCLSHNDVRYFNLNSDKVPKWIGEKLKELGLRSEEKNESWDANHYLVRKDASDFLMSFVAHYLGINRGMSPLTNNKMSHFATFLNQIGNINDDKPSGENLNSFISGVFNIMIPSDLDKLSFEEVIKIRSEYDGFRKGAGNFIQVVADEFKLNEIINKKRAEEVIKSSLNEFNKEVEKFKKGNWQRAFKSWEVQSVSTLLGTVAGFLAGGPPAAIGMMVGAGSISVINHLAGKEETSDIKKCIQYFNQINQQLQLENINKDLIHYRSAVLESYPYPN